MGDSNDDLVVAAQLTVRLFNAVYDPETSFIQLIYMMDLNDSTISRVFHVHRAHDTKI